MSNTDMSIDRNVKRFAYLLCICELLATLWAFPLSPINMGEELNKAQNVPFSAIVP